MRLPPVLENIDEINKILQFPAMPPQRAVRWSGERYSPAELEPKIAIPPTRFNRKNIEVFVILIIS